MGNLIESYYNVYRNSKNILCMNNLVRLSICPFVFPTAVARDGGVYNNNFTF